MNNLINKIIHADCMEVLRTLPDKCVDLVLTDPPYGIGMDTTKGCYHTRNNLEAIVKKDWDSAPIGADVLAELHRVSRHQIIWGGNYYGLKGKSWLVWDKGEGFTGRSYAELEMAWTSHDRPARIFKYDPLASGAYHGKIHPTQKPLALWEWCMREFSAPGELVLDPFSGSGTTAIAAHRLGRRFICIEKDADYYAASVERLHRERQQLQLPGLLAGPEPQQGNLWERRGN